MAEGEEDSAVYAVQYLDGHKEKTNWLSRAGLAMITYANGDTFEGRFNSHRQRDGKGRYTWSLEDGQTATYDGEYRAGRRHGLGMMRYPDGSTYEGLWKDDVREGRGTLVYANGDTYTGRFSAGKPNGHGAYQFASPKSYLLGKWVDGEFIRGRWAKTDGSAYYGQFKNGQPINNGLFYNPSGLKQEARYEEAKLGEEEEADPEGENVPLSRTFVAGRVERSRAGPDYYSSAVVDPQDSEDFVLYAHKVESPEEAKSEEKIAEPVSSEIVEQESSMLQSLFQSIDSSEDGKISLDELIAALQSADNEHFQPLLDAVPLLRESDLHDSVKEIDQDNDGRLSLDEFIDYFYAMKLFTLVDEDGSRQIRHSELQNAMREHAEYFPPALLRSTSGSQTSRIAISSLISAGDSDDDRLLSFKEFLYLLFSVTPPEE